MLVVEDEALIRWSIAETLAHGGHTVVEATDAKAYDASDPATSAYTGRDCTCSASAAPCWVPVSRSRWRDRFVIVHRYSPT